MVIIRIIVRCCVCCGTRRSHFEQVHDRPSSPVPAVDLRTATHMQRWSTCADCRGSYRWRCARICDCNACRRPNGGWPCRIGDGRDARDVRARIRAGGSSSRRGRRDSRSDACTRRCPQRCVWDSRHAGWRRWCTKSGGRRGARSTQVPIGIQHTISFPVHSITVDDTRSADRTCSCILEPLLKAGLVKPMRTIR